MHTIVVFFLVRFTITMVAVHTDQVIYTRRMDTRFTRTWTSAKLLLFQEMTS